MEGTVVTYVDRKKILRPLIIMLNDFLKPGAPFPIPEIVYLNQMSALGRLPGEKFYPHAIITYMLERHGKVAMNVMSKPRLVKRFQCQYFEEGQPRMYEFSNKMPLYADIITLHYLNVILEKHGTFHRHRIHQLAMLMKSKYVIYDDIYCDTCKINYETCEVDCENVNCLCNDPKKITFGRIFRSYLSVMMWMHAYIPDFTAIVRSLFPYSTLPAMMCSSYFPLILSRKVELDDKHLVAVNLAICAAYETIIPILSIYHRLIQCYTSYDVYTEDMRIEISNKLGIVINRNGRYFLAPTFEKYRVYFILAGNRIRSMRKDDTTLDKTLEKIEQVLF